MQHKRTCHICEALCGLVIEHDGKAVLSIRGNPDDVFSRGHICPKATAIADLHTDPDRLRTPVRRVGDRWEPIGWEEAINWAAQELHRVQQQYGRSAVGVYAGNPNAHHYGSLLAGIAFHGVLRSRARFSATSVDQLPHMFAALEMFGHQLMLPVPDLDRTDRLVVLGANPLVSNGSIMSAGGAGRRIAAIRERGGRVVVLDPRLTETAEKADEFHFVRPGTDALLELAVIHTLFAESLVDDGAWRQWTDGVEALQALAAEFAPEVVADAVGLRAEQIRRLAREHAAAPAAVWYARFGACTQEFGGLSAWLAVAINVLTGNLDRPGGLMFAEPPVDLLGIGSRVGQSGHFDVWRSRVSGLPEFGGELPVAALAEEIETPGPGQLRALVLLAGNPVLSTPEGNRLANALGSLDFMVALDMYVTASSRHAHLILPPLSPLERDHYPLVFGAVSVRNHAHYSEPLFPPPPGHHDDAETLLALAAQLQRLRGGAGNLGRSLGLRALQRAGLPAVLDIGLRTGPHGQLRHPRGTHRLSLAALKAAPDGIDLGPLQPCLPGRLHHSDKRVRLTPDRLAADLPRLRARLDRPAPPLQLIGRRQLRSNNTWLHNAPRLMRGAGRCTLLMHPDDAARSGVVHAGRARLVSRTGAVEVTVELTRDIMPGVVSLPHGWGHDAKGAQLRVATQATQASVNDVTDAAFVDALTGTSALSGVAVQVEPLGVHAEAAE